MSQEVIEITEREIEVVEVIEKGLIGPTGPTGPQANINYTVVTANQTLSNSQNIAADTSGGSFTLTLPASPNAGDSIDIFDYANTFDTNPLTIARNGQNIESLAENLTANVEGAYFTLIYTGATRGWQILPRYGVSGIEDVLSAEGDLLYRGASSETRLPIGTAGQVLKVNSGATAPEWGSISGSISVTGSDLTLSGATGTAITNATLANDAVSNAKLANMAQSTIKGRATASTGDPEDLSASQVRTILNVADGAEVNVQSNWTESNSGSDAFILNKPTLGTAAAAATTDFAAAVHTHAASDVITGTFDNARINFAAPPAIGSTTPAAISGTTGTFSTLTANNGTLTASAPVLDLAQTWNNAAVAFTALRINVTNTNSLASSKLLDVQSGGSSDFSVYSSRRVTLGQFSPTFFGPSLELSSGTGFYDSAGIRVTVAGTNSLIFTATGMKVRGGTLGFTSGDETVLVSDANDVLAMRRGTNPNTFNIYNTFTSATNHERGFLRWNSNVFEIGTEEGSGGGSRRDLRLKTGIGTHVDIMAGGGTLAWRFNSSGELVPNATNTRDFGNVSTRVRTGFFENLFVGTTFEIYNARTSATNFERLNIRKASNEFIIDAQVGADGGTLRGIKIGSATSSLLGFFGATPVVQQALTADLLDSLQGLGLVASGSGDTPLNLSGGTLTAGNLVANNGTLTASAPVLDLAQTWNNAAVTFTGMRFNATNTASESNSLFAEFQTGGVTQFAVRNTGEIRVRGVPRISNLVGSTFATWITGGYNNLLEVHAPQLRLGADGSGSTRLFVDATHTFAQRDGTNAQTFNIYNTFTSATNHERGFLKWSSNVFQIGTEKGSAGGAARDLVFQTDGVSRLTITATGGMVTPAFVQIGGATSAHVALKRNSNTLQIRTADDFGFGGLLCGALTLNGNLDASTRNIVTDTTTGTKIGTATTQKIGFFNATPVVQQASVADATDAASTQDRLNDLLARLRTLGLIAT